MEVYEPIANTTVLVARLTRQQWCCLPEHKYETHDD